MLANAKFGWSRRAWLAPVLLALMAGVEPVGAQEVEREGGQWVRSAHTEPKPLPAMVKRIEILSHGNVVVRGSDDDTVQVKVKQRVRARSQEEADLLWGSSAGIVPFKAAGDVVRLEFPRQRSVRVMADIEITVPRKMALVRVNNIAGKVQVYDMNGDVWADTTGGHLVLDRIRGSVRSHTGLGDVQLGAIGGSVVCSTGGGTITIKNAQADADCTNGGGDITVESVAGPLRVTTEGGNIHVAKAGSNVWAKSLAGQVEVGSAKGTVFADSAAGGVRVHGGSGPLNVSAVMGNIIADLLAGARMGDSSLTAGSGDIVVRIPESLGLAVRAHNAAGTTPRIVSDFPEMQMKSITFRAPGAGWVGQGSINGGGPVLDLNTNGGIIYLRRAK